jgi:hypothetical protein
VARSFFLDSPVRGLYRTHLAPEQQLRLKAFDDGRSLASRKCKEIRIMKVHQELRIGPLTGENETELVSRIETSLSNGWSRNQTREKEVNLMGLSSKLFCFSCTANERRAAATLFLARPASPSEGLIYVSNIVPNETQRLTYDQYNSILREFFDRFAKPSADAIGIRIDLSSSEQTLEDWLSPELAGLLKSFSRAANKSTGSSHPMDQQRWFDFLIAIHRAHAHLDTGLLERWLVEEENWPGEAAFDLICEFEFAEGLLKRFDR